MPTSARDAPALGVAATTSVCAGTGAGATATGSARCQRLSPNSSNARRPRASSSHGSQLIPFAFLDVNVARRPILMVVRSCHVISSCYYGWALSCSTTARIVLSVVGMCTSSV